MHSFKPGDIVTIFAMTFGGKFIVEGRAKIKRMVKDVDEQYVVNFLDKNGNLQLGERYERFVDPMGQNDPQAHLDRLNTFRAA